MYGLTGMPSAPSERRIPPTVAVVANSTDSTGTSTGDAVIRIAAAAGVHTIDSTSSAPTTGIDTATVTPSSSMNSGESSRTGTPRAAAPRGRCWRRSAGAR